MPTNATWLGLPVEIAVGLAMLLVLTAYAVLAGADFGGGVWDLLALGRRRQEQRQAIATAMGPVWEANHVWLIFMLVILFTAFPSAFSALSIAFFAPLHLVLLGIVLRGAAFVFRANFDATSPRWRTWARVFGIASVMTPFLLGTAVGAVSSGGIRISDGAVVASAAQTWLSPVSLLIGGLTLALTAYLAAVFLTVETQGELAEDFRKRALAAGVAVMWVAVMLLPVISRLSPLLWEHLSKPTSLPPILGGVLLAVASGWAVWSRRYRLGRILAVAEVVVVLWGWAFAQWPYIIYPDFTVYNSAAPGPSIRFLLNTLPFGFALLIPSLWFLFVTFKWRRHPNAGETTK